MARVEIVLKEQLLLLLKNRTRRRRILGKYLADFNILIGEADCLEAKLFGEDREGLEKQMLFQWIFARAVEAVVEYVNLGFSLELYTVEDLGMVMFYLDFLYGTLVNCKSTLLRFLTSKQGKKLRKKLKVKQVQDSLALLNGHQLLARGIVRLYIIFLHFGCVAALGERVEAARFAKRFEALNALAVPQKLEYSAYAAVKGLPETMPTESMIAACHECFSLARGAFSELPAEDVKSLVRVAASNSFAISRAKRTDWHCQISLNLGEHPVFPVCEVSAL